MQTPLRLVLLCVLVTSPTLALAGTAPTDAFLCQAASPRDAGLRSGPLIGIDDHYTPNDSFLRRVKRLCRPVSTSGGLPMDGDTHLVGHAARTPGPHPRKEGVDIAPMEIGDDLWRATRPRLLLLPSAVDPGAPPAVLDHSSHAVDGYRCYASRRQKNAPDPATGQVVSATDGTGTTRSFTLGPVRNLCSPMDAGGNEMKNPRWFLACYAAKPTGDAASPEDLYVATAHSSGQLRSRVDKELCLPTTAVHACNGAPELCDRAYDQVSYVTNHNAYSNLEDGFVGPNQRFDVVRQLDDGVRGFMLDTYDDGGVMKLCHSFCALGSRPLIDTLNELRDFLERHPYEVVTIIFEAYISAADTQSEFATAGLLPYLHAQPSPGSPWPTLKELIDADTRLIVLTDDSSGTVGGTIPWHHYVWDYAFETHYSFEEPGDFSCAPNRGNPAHSLFILNHFLTQVFGSAELADMVNHNPLLIDRAQQCQAENSALPNFVTVDFHDIGDALQAVATLNGVAP